MTKYSLRDIVDLSKLQNLMDKFYNLTGISHYIVSKDGEILAKTDMQYVCKKFHIDIQDTKVNAMMKKLKMVRLCI